jgi:hypothetical protein
MGRPHRILEDGVRARWTPEEYRQRPRELDFKLADIIIERIANGEMLTEICDDRDYPLPATFLRWLREDPNLQSLYNEALELRTELLVEGMVEVADSHDSKRAKNQLDARRFHAERLMPGKYGPRAFTAEVKPGEDEGGIDYGAEVRRKLASMAQSLRQPEAE